MTQFLSLLISGISLGAIYALIALGFVVIFKSSEVVSFVHGSLLLLGAYLAVQLQGPLGFWLGCLVAIAITGLVGLFIDRVLLSRVRGAPVISLAILTIGLDILLSTELIRRIGSDILNIRHPWGGKVLHFGAVGITANRAIAILVAGGLIGLFFLAFKYSSWGVATRAAAEDGEAAALMGIRLGRVSSAAWVVGASLAAVAGIFLVGSPTPGVTGAVGATALRAFPAAILGGLDSTFGALVGGLIVGVTETLASGYQDQLAFLGRGFGAVVPYIVMLAVLLVRPSGLFGTRELTRV